MSGTTGISYTGGPLYRPAPGTPERDYQPRYPVGYRPARGLSIGLTGSPAERKPRASPVRDLPPKVAGLARESARQKQPSRKPIRPDSIRHRVLRLFRDEPREWRSAEVAERFRISPDTAATILSRMAGEGALQRRKDPNRKQHRLYRLPGMTLDGEKS